MMSTIDELAARFWRLAGSPPRYPRSLDAAIVWALPLAIVKLPRLRVATVDAWLTHQGAPDRVGSHDRRLRACLVAFQGRGIVFLDGGDAVDEQRYSLAHEAAHFLTDYMTPREVILERLGPEYADVLDGLRLATKAERIDSLLVGIRLGVHRHLMDRGPSDADRWLASESRADRLALELLAPRAEVVRQLRLRGGPTRLNPIETIDLLTSRFGLPASVATSYAERLTLHPRPARSVNEWLGEPVELSSRRRKSV